MSNYPLGAKDDPRAPWNEKPTRMKEIESETAYPQSVSVMLALGKVWNECEQGSKWVSVDDYLPEQETPVLIYIISGGGTPNINWCLC